MTDRQLLELFIRRSGHRHADGSPNLRRVAREELLRDVRTVQRWRSGASPIPGVVTDHMRRQLRPAGAVRRARRRPAS